MRRIVYAPFVQAFIRTSTDQVVDISPYLTAGEIDRKVNQVSSAQLTVRNPIIRDGAPGIINSPTAKEAANLLFTEFPFPDGSVGPLFHPMDPIIIVMQRLQNHPIQMFTGYLDRSPYIQLFPGLCSIEASCSLKRLLYTQWDAALPWVINFLEQYGWVLNAGSGIANPTAETSKIKAQAGQLKGSFNDGSIGALLYAVLTNIGNWPSDSIFIEALPPTIKDIVVNLYNVTSQEAQQGSQLFESLITQILGATSQGTGSATGTGNTTNLTSAGTGSVWEVQTSAEGSTGSGNGGSYSEPGGGWTELSTNPGAGCPGPAPPCCDFAALGHYIPSVGRTLMNISGDQGKTWHVMPQLDVGCGSTGLTANGFAGAAIGLTDNALTALGVSKNSTVYIQLHSGTDLSIPQGFGKLISSNPATLQGNPGGSANTGGKAGGSTSPSNHPAKVVQGAHKQFLAKRIKGTGSKTLPGSLSRPAGGGGATPGSSAGSTAANVTPNVNGVINPIPGWTIGRDDMGVDACAPAGTAVLAPADCVLVGTCPNWLPTLYLYKFTSPLSGTPNGCQNWYVAEGVAVPSKSSFKQGETVTTSTGGCIEVGWGSSTIAGQCTLAGQQGDGAAANPPSGSTTQWGEGFKSYFGVGGGTAVKGTTTGGGTTTGSATSAVAAAFSTFIELPSTFSSAEALAFTGKRSFIADQPLFPFVDQLCQASLRNFMSMPNGNFFAFFPDYFGLFGRKYYWEVSDLEIIDGRIDLTDDPLVTNVAVAGDVTQYHGTVDVFDLILTSGIFDIFDAFATNYVNTTGQNQVPTLANPTPNTKTKTKTKGKGSQAQANTAGRQQALAFLQRYGARPYVEEAPMIRSPFFELFLAFQRFMQMWSKQFVTTFELTFMPEVFPGGLILLQDHGIQVYVEEVVHSFDYEQGFTTTISVSSPTKIGDQAKITVPTAGTAGAIPTTIAGAAGQSSKVPGQPGGIT